MPEMVEQLPADAVLVHVGFHKTGTTALQDALARVRPDLLEVDVLYPGELRSHHRAAMAVTERTWGWGDQGGRKHRPKYWDDLVAASGAHPGRVMISSEALSLAREPAIDRMVAELGADRLHVVGTLRPFERIVSVAGLIAIAALAGRIGYGGATATLAICSLIGVALFISAALARGKAAPMANAGTKESWKRGQRVGKRAPRSAPDHVSRGRSRCT